MDLYNKCIEHLNKQEVDMAIEKMQLNAMVAVSRDDEVTLI